MNKNQSNCINDRLRAPITELIFRFQHTLDSTRGLVGRVTIDKYAARIYQQISRKSMFRAIVIRFMRMRAERCCSVNSIVILFYDKHSCSRMK